ncbi:Putative ankyrin repeat protein [Termitomyces sp. J132]|nr:Putative ankyrin repeat protein [Termitomyces sp. J132]
MALGEATANRGKNENENPNPNNRIYDYKQKYSADKVGEEFNENARVWNVYLDEAENYDADVIQGYQNIMDGLLVFASLFSAVVTTFVAQTSQALQSDNTQNLVSILLETNQLLRAAGNSTNLNAVPPAALGCGRPTDISTVDQWVNGLFFTSLTLSLSTALLTVLAQQWIQVYTSAVSGGARTRALIRHFRFQGLVKWRLGDVIESLPIILHTSVAIFLVGLALYVSQFSFPICGVVAFITTLTFLFYLGTSMIPAIFVDCPYRLPFLFPLAQLIVFVFCTVKHAVQFLWQQILSGRTDASQVHIIWPTMSTKSLKDEEHYAVFSDTSDIDKSCSPFSRPRTTGQFTCDALNWLINHSLNSSVKEIVFEGICGLVKEDESFSLGVIKHDLFPQVVLFALDKFVDMALPSTTTFEESPWFKLIEKINKVCLGTGWGHYSEFTLLNCPLTHNGNWKEQIWIKIKKTLESALLHKDHVLTKNLLRWCQHEIQQMGIDIFRQIVEHGNKENISYALNNGLDINWHNDNGYTLLHAAVGQRNLDGVMVLVERNPSLIDIQAQARQFPYSELQTALDMAVESQQHTIVAYLLDNGANRRPDALHVVTTNSNKWYSNPDLIRLLLDKGWDRSAKDVEGRTPIDIATANNCDDIVEILESYHVRVKPKSAVSDALDSQSSDALIAC